MFDAETSCTAEVKLFGLPALIRPNESRTMILDRTNLQGTIVKATLSLYSISTVLQYMYCSIETNVHKIGSE